MKVYKQKTISELTEEIQSVKTLSDKINKENQDNLEIGKMEGIESVFEKLHSMDANTVLESGLNNNATGHTFDVFYKLYMKSDQKKLIAECFRILTDCELGKFLDEAAAVLSKQL